MWRDIPLVSIFIQLVTVEVCLSLYYHHHGGHTGGSSSHSCDYQEYDNIMDLGDSNVCMDENKVFTLLKALNDKSHVCRMDAINQLAGVFSGVTDTPASCQCSGHNAFQFYNHKSDDVRHCWPDSDFDKLFNRFFYHIGEPQIAPPCRSHHAMWTLLSHVDTSTHYSSKSCQNIIVEHLGSLFANNDPCSCTNTSLLQTVTTIKPYPSATSTTTTTTTATAPKAHVSATTNPPAATSAIKMIPVSYSCGKLSTIESIALQHHLDQQNASQCSTANQHGSDEAFVLTNCNAPDQSLWKQGAQVMQHCMQIPTYTPVATFIGSTYHPSLAQSGVFLGCVDRGFKLGVQHCNSTPTIDHVLRSSSGLQNADYYYVIE